MGKISVKHYLNKKVKPSIDPDDPNIAEYPIYYYITVNRKTIHKPSHAGNYMSEADFMEWSKYNGRIYDLIKRESDIIIKACEHFVSDWEAGAVKTEYQSLFKRGFTSKDDFINGLNSYISFYTQSIFSIFSTYTEDKINRYITQKVEACFDTSMLDLRESHGGEPLNRYRGLDIKISTSQMLSTETSFFQHNLSPELLRTHYIHKCLYRCLASTNIKYGYDLPLIEWVSGDLKESIFNHLKTIDFKGLFLGEPDPSILTREYFDMYFVPEIDNVCSLDTQIQLYASWLRLIK